MCVVLTNPFLVSVCSLKLAPQSGSSSTQGKSVHDSARYTRGAYGLMVRLTCQDGAGAGQPGVYRVRAHAAASVYEIFEICEPR